MKASPLMRAWMIACACTFAAPMAQALHISDPFFIGPFQNDLLPPGSVGHYAGRFHSYGGGAVVLNNPLHFGFVGMGYPPPPPIPGPCTTGNLFGGSIGGNLGGNNVTAPATARVEVCFAHTSGVNDREFDTEMLQLDVMGGDLPPTHMIRLTTGDAQRRSTGHMVIRGDPGGPFQIASFFDVFTELSLDGGMTWIPSDGDGGGRIGATRMTLVSEPASTALVALALVGLALSRRRRH